MSAITAELLPDSAAVRLSISAAAGIRSITRADANGINDVRTGEAVLDVVPDLAFQTTNLVPNPSFETGVGNWTASRCTLAQYAFFSDYWKGYAPGPAGAQGLRISSLGTGSTYAFSDMFAVTAGQFVAVSAIGSCASGSWRIGINYYDAGGASVGSPLASGYLGAGSSVYNLVTGTLSAVVPETAVNARVLIYIHSLAGGNAEAGKLGYFDRVMAVQASTLAAAESLAAVYHDGGFSESIKYKTAWTGTAHASASTRSVPVTPMVVTDYEAASGPLRYDVVDKDGRLETLEVSGFTLDAPWLFTPVIPGYSRKAVAVTGIDTGFEDLSTIHSGLLGRPDPVVVMRPMGMRSGTLDIYAGTYAEARDILSPLTRATVMMLRQPEHAGMDMYFAPAGGSPQIINLTTAGGETVWGVKVPYVEVKRPEGPLAGALGWTYAELTAAVPRYYDLPRTFASYADMRLNKRKTP